MVAEPKFHLVCKARGKTEIEYDELMNTLSFIILYHRLYARGESSKHLFSISQNLNFLSMWILYYDLNAIYVADHFRTFYLSSNDLTTSK